MRRWIMRKTSITCLAFMLALRAGGSAFGLTGDEILAKAEQALAGPKDYEGLSTMVLANSDGTQKEQRSLRIWISGKEKRVIKFVSPPGIEGIGLLTESSDEMYLYLPAQNKIRRIEGGSKNDDFQGTDFSYNEMGSFDYKKDYAAEVTAEDDASWTLALVKKAGVDRPYDRLVMVVDKADYVPRTIEMYRSTRMQKLLSILEVKKTDAYMVPTRLRMENREKKHYTEMTISDIRFDQGLEAKDVFSKRFLKKKP
jgi:outer membrane lipoprotein-sorting protein